jgi:hypothetical protein
VARDRELMFKEKKIKGKNIEEKNKRKAKFFQTPLFPFVD